MDLWLLLLLLTSLSSAALLTLLLLPPKHPPLPPGPPSVPILGTLLFLRHSLHFQITQLITNLPSSYGPILTVHLGSRPTIIISHRSLAHKALVLHAPLFSDRPPPLPAFRALNPHRTISSASYGPFWRLLRRNLAAKLRLLPTDRAWVLHLLLQRLHSKSLESPNGTVIPKESFQFAMFSLLVLMCFGKKLDEKAIKNIESAHTKLISYSRKLNAFSFVPKIAKYVFLSKMEDRYETKTTPK